MITSTKEEFQNLLNKYQEAVNKKEYKKIPYEIWRRLRKLSNPRIECGDSTFIKIFDAVDDKNEVDNYIYRFETIDDGFGRFFYDNYIKERTKVNNTTTTLNITATSAADAAAYATSTCINSNIANCTTGTNLYYSPDTVTTNIPDFYTKTNMTGTASYSNANLQLEETKKENKKMKGFNFDFGPCGDTVRMSMYGLAVKNQAGEWVSYDSNNSEIVNVDVFNFADSGKWFYKMPVSIDNIEVGQLIIHNKKPCYVVGFAEDTSNPIVIDIFNMERKEILPQKSPFHFDYVTQIVSLLDSFGGKLTADADHPFGNLLPLMLLGGNGKSEDMLLPFVMMNQCGNENTQLFGNPMMLYFLMKDNKDFDPMMLMFMTQNK